jgi:hypothetical protein
MSTTKTTAWLVAALLAVACGSSSDGTANPAAPAPAYAATPGAGPPSDAP